MVQLHVLGSVELRDSEGRELTAILAQPKRLALLVYLAVNARGFCRRDSLMAVFWPELDRTRARWALNQSVRFLRKQLGGTVLVSRGGEELGVDSAAVWCDASALREHLDAGRYADALDLYRGDFLDGFFADAGSGFQEWMDRERSQLRSAAAHAARSVAEDREREEDFTTAVAAARRAVELSEVDERVVRELLALLDRLGDRAGALQAYENFARKLAEEYDAKPAAETQALIDNIRARAEPAVPPNSAGNGRHSSVGAPGAASEVVRQTAGVEYAPAATETLTAAPSAMPRYLFLGGVLAAAVGAWLLFTRLLGNDDARRAHDIESAAVRRWDIALPDSAPLAFIGSAPIGVGHTSLAMSTDGRRIVYAAQRGATTLLYLRDLDDLTVVPLAGTEGAFRPFFSPDGRWVGFLTTHEFKKVSITGGQPVTLAPTVAPTSAEWQPDGRILIADHEGNRLAWLPSGGGPMQQIGRDVATRAMSPQVVGDGHWILYGSTDRVIYMHALDTGHDYAIVRTGIVRRDSANLNELIHGSSPFYLASGHIGFFAGDGTLMAFPFDLRNRRVLGPPMPVVEGIRLEAEEGDAQVAVTTGGTLVYAPGESARLGAFVWVDHLSGRLDTLPLPRAAYGAFDLSPDGKRIAVRVQPASGPNELWVLDVDGAGRARIPTRSTVVGSPRWWPDGTHLLYEEFWPSAGRGDRQFKQFRHSLTDGPARQELPINGLEPTPEDRVVIQLDGGSAWFTPIDGEGRRERLTVSKGAWFPNLSPDRAWLAWMDTDDPSGQSEVYLTRVGRPTESLKISPAGGDEPIWAPDGKSIVYRNGLEWLAVDVSTDRTVRVGRPRRLFRGPFLQVAGWSHDVAPDGTRELVLLGPRATTTTRLVAVTNWLTELGRVAPARAK